MTDPAPEIPLPLPTDYEENDPQHVAHHNKLSYAFNTIIEEAPLNAARHGVKGDGSTDDAAALNAALTLAGTGPRGRVYIPKMSSWIKVQSATVTVPPQTVLFSDAYQEIRGTGSADTITLGTGAGHVLDGIYASATGSGNVLNIPSAYHVAIRDCQLVQYVPTKHILRHASALSFIDITVEKTTFNAAANASVAPIHLENSANGLNGTQWRDLRLNGNNGMTAPFMRFLNTAPLVNGNSLNNHSFRDITAEHCIAGVLHMSSVNGVTVEHVSPWDIAGDYTDDIFKFYTQPDGTPCRNISVAHSGRRGGGLAAGKYDINFSTAATECIAMFMSPMHLPLAAAEILMPIVSGLKIGCNGGGGSGSAFVESSYGGAFRIPRPGSGDRLSAAAAGSGAMVYNATTNKPNWSDGTNWRDATGTIV